jgi:hypothetical protein
MLKKHKPFFGWLEMKTTLFVLSLMFLSFNASAKTVITLAKSSSSCSVGFETSTVNRIDGKRYLGFDITDINLADLYMARGVLETSVSSQWLNTGERYFISAYINGSVGPKHIPFEIPIKSDDYNRYVDIDVDEALPCTCFKGVEKPTRCNETSYLNITFQDGYGNLWRQTGENTAERVVD